MSLSPEGHAACTNPLTTTRSIIPHTAMNGHDAVHSRTCTQQQHWGHVGSRYPLVPTLHISRELEVFSSRVSQIVICDQSVCCQACLLNSIADEFVNCVKQYHSTHADCQSERSLGTLFTHQHPLVCSHTQPPSQTPSLSQR